MQPHSEKGPLSIAFFFFLFFFFQRLTLRNNLMRKCDRCNWWWSIQEGFPREVFPLEFPVTNTFSYLEKISHHEYIFNSMYNNSLAWLHHFHSYIQCMNIYICMAKKWHKQMSITLWYTQLYKLTMILEGPCGRTAPSYTWNLPAVFGTAFNRPVSP